MKHLFLFIAIQLFLLNLQAQHKYWIFLEAKPLLTNKAPALSPKALERRSRQNIPIDAFDYPISSFFTQQLSEKGIHILQKSRWLNAVSANLTSQQLAEIQTLPFVKNIRPVAISNIASVESCDPKEDLDTYRAQLSQIGLDDVHALGFRGKGIMIAVLDNGFSGIDTVPAFQHVWERNGFVYAEDFVEKGTSLYGSCTGSCKHGAHVLSIMAGRLPGGMMGAAPDADFLLFRTENDTSETHQEEDNWMAAAEKADSLGADIITSSLTYRDFDLGEGDYTDAEIDGKTALVTIAAEIAASKGILVFNSAGNYGLKGIAPPADGPSVLAIGSVTQEGELSNFSSVGPTFDGRIKPDLVARGGMSYFVKSDGTISQGNGTSFSAPLVAGFAACLWQADNRQHTAAEMRDILRQSGTQYSQPDNEFGFGLPQANMAFERLTGESLPCVPAANIWGEDIAKIYPNPSNQHFHLALQGLKDGQMLEISIFDLVGRKMLEMEHTFRSTYELIQFENHWNPGHYILRVQAKGGGFLFAGKVVIRN